MAETAAESCPDCGELVEFGIPQDKRAVKEVKPTTSTHKNVKNIICSECNNKFGIVFR
ncbi:hypothetical protein [Halorubellus sp. PRR65]|uniref:hypothetical protein n=1 Tax=Halorubellus sp. PRR65 TaxID=3098148 RepID=UPI002B25BEBB|nr:hypothetical protein [Halorubellus sp. PRR65]